jgi:hypothetical protein
VAFALREAFNGTAEAAAAAGYSGSIRILNNGIMWPPYGNTTGLLAGWQHPNASTMADFSAVCWYSGWDVWRALGGSVPLGLISNEVGGTGVEQWSDGAALRHCSSIWPSAPLKPGTARPGCHGTACNGMTLDTCEATNTTQQWEKAGPWCSGLWDQMMTPLLPMSLRAVLFYQGENNNCVAEADGEFRNDTASCPPPSGGFFYSCAFPALIASWRAAFDPPAAVAPQLAAAGTERQGGPLPFIFAELDGFAASNFAVIRAAQIAAADADPHTRIVANHDLGTLNDKGGKIHSPRKEELGRRFSLHIAQLVYNASTFLPAGDSGAAAAAAAAAAGDAGLVTTAAGAGSAAAVVARGPTLVSAELHTLAPADGSRDDAIMITALFDPGDAGADTTTVYLHGTAGCIGKPSVKSVPTAAGCDDTRASCQRVGRAVTQQPTSIAQVSPVSTFYTPTLTNVMMRPRAPRVCSQVRTRHRRAAHPGHRLVCENGDLEPFIYYKCDLFTKRGSGQT